MKLLISKEFDKSFTEDTAKLSTSMLQFPSTHMYIASNHWDSCTIWLDDSIPANSLLHLGLVADEVKVHLPENITDVTLHQLIELYPEKAGRLRRCFMSGQPLTGVLEECLA